MAAPAAAALSVRVAARTPLLRWILASVVALPVLVVMLLLVALGGLGTQHAGAQGTLRPGVVPTAYEALILRAAQTCAGVTAPLLAAQLDAESGWNPNSVSPVGAQGLAQFIPGTWVGEGVDGDGDGIRDPFNPADAIASQASFMCKLLAAVSTDRGLMGDPLALALAAYNAGLGAVQKYAGVPPYAETQNYVRRILSLTDTYSSPIISGPVGSWVAPVTGPITSGYGQRWGRLHAGVDFGVPIGTPVHAASGGTVIAIGPVAGFGQWVKIAHGGGITTVYGHIRSWTVTVGQAVRAGQLIAKSGNEGESTGPHLHFEIRIGADPVDPTTFYAAKRTSLS
jgi:murein DD-endopeptidase MepM/ murein hydrolase activator NlpD